MASDTDAAAIAVRAARCLEAGDIEGAVAAYSECALLAPQNAGVLNNLGAVLIKAHRDEEAIPYLERAVRLRAGYARPLVNLGKALRELGRTTEALDRLREALAIDPDYSPALTNLGDALAASGRLEDAEHALQRALAITPDHVETYMTLGMVQVQRGQFDDSIRLLHRAVELAPDHAEAHSNLAHVLFCSGDWQAAWPHFEYRLRRATSDQLQIPRGTLPWNGVLQGVSGLLLIAEQGLGDQLQFARYAKSLQERGAPCTLLCNPRLMKLLKGSQIPVIAGADLRQDPDTRWFPLMSLANWHQTRADTVPFSAGYLSADAERITHWRGRLPIGQRLTVALAWAGNPRMETGRYAGRSPGLAAFAPLMELRHVSFLSLQKGDAETQLDTVAFGVSILRLPELDPGPDAFIDTAALLKCVDVLVTSDTAIAHLAGGLGVRTWLCLKHDPDWRWMLSGGTTPWYTSMRLFRQRSPGDWNGVFLEVAAALRQLRDPD